MLLFLAALIAAPPAHAFRLEPMVLSIPVTAPRAAGTYVVENDSREKVAVEFKVTGRRVDREGKEERPDAQGFLVYPPQLALGPGEKRSVRVTWSGPGVPVREESFRFVATQLPVNFTKGASGRASIRFLLEYVASLYLVPPNVAPAPRVKEQRVRGQNLEVLVANEGGAHQLLERTDISLRADGHALPIAAEVLNEIRTGNILPGEERILRLPLPAGVRDAKASFRFTP